MLNIIQKNEYKRIRTQKLTQYVHHMRNLARMHRRYLADVITAVLRRSIRNLQRVPIDQANSRIGRHLHLAGRQDGDAALPGHHVQISIHHMAGQRDRFVELELERLGACQESGLLAAADAVAFAGAVHCSGWGETKRNQYGELLRTPKRSDRPHLYDYISRVHTIHISHLKFILLMHIIKM